MKEGRRRSQMGPSPLLHCPSPLSTGSSSTLAVWRGQTNRCVHRAGEPRSAEYRNSQKTKLKRGLQLKSITVRSVVSGASQFPCGVDLVEVKLIFDPDYISPIILTSQYTKKCCCTSLFYYLMNRFKDNMSVFQGHICQQNACCIES